MNKSLGSMQYVVTVITYLIFSLKQICFLLFFKRDHFKDTAINAQFKEVDNL